MATPDRLDPKLWVESNRLWSWPSTDYVGAVNRYEEGEPLASNYVGRHR